MKCSIRNFIGFFLVTWVLIVFSTLGISQEKPVTEAEKPAGLGNPVVHKLTENVYAITGLYHSAGEGVATNAGIIFTSRSVVFIDAGMTIASGEFLWKTAQEQMKVKDKLYLILTHHHSDHIFGMKVMKEKGARVIAHKFAEGFLKYYKDKYKDMIINRMGWDAQKGEEILGDVLISLPDETIEQDTALRIDGDDICLLYTPGHVPSEISVYHPKSKTLFAGDAIYEGLDLTTRFGGPEEWKMWVFQLERLTELDIEVIVPGHGKLCGKEEIERNIDFLKKLSSLTTRAASPLTFQSSLTSFVSLFTFTPDGWMGKWAQKGSLRKLSQNQIPIPPSIGSRRKPRAYEPVFKLNPFSFSSFSNL